MLKAMLPLELWDDSLIVQDNRYVQGKGRVYRCGNKEYSSVTTILKKFEDQSFLPGWVKRVGKEESDRIRDQASSHGTACHEALENHLKLQHPHLILQENPSLLSLAPDEQELAIAGMRERLRLTRGQEKLITPFRPLFPYIKPVALEKRIFWNNNDDLNVGFGGTADAYKLIDISLLPSGAKPFVREGDTEYALVILDWKNFNKQKRPIEYKRNGGCYFPLLKYALQLSAYSAAFNKLTGVRYRLCQGVLACAWAVNQKVEACDLKTNKVKEVETPTGEYELDLYYFDSRSIAWFWKRFQEILHAYYHGGEFSWNHLCSDAHEAGVLGEKLQLS